MCDLILQNNNDETLFYYSYLIRQCENKLLELFQDGLISGTIHTAIGQEISQASVGLSLNPDHDMVFSSHRNHGYLISFTKDITKLAAEVLGKVTGFCKGLGGSQHMATHNFHSNGILGGTSALAVGRAYAKKVNGEKGLVSICLGDGSMNEGIVYESMNLSAIWDVPLLFIVEANGIAQSTYLKDTFSGTLENRARGFGITSYRFSDRSHTFFKDIQNCIRKCRKRKSPAMIIIDTARMGAHSKGDDTRSVSELDSISINDPLVALGKRLNTSVRDLIYKKVEEDVSKAFNEAINSAKPIINYESIGFFNKETYPKCSSKQLEQHRTVREEINYSLEYFLETNTNGLLLGQDICDPYGGAFKVSMGLSSKFKDRVINMPISEGAIVGAGIGLAISGKLPVVEIMFSDFLTLTIDQILNQALKLPWLDPNISVPLVIRSPSGGHRGYGPTHSQSLELLFASLPGMTVVVPSVRHNISELLINAIVSWPYPTLFVENKVQYDETVSQNDYEVAPVNSKDIAADLFPVMRKTSNDVDITIIVFGGTLRIAEKAAEILFDTEEIHCEIIVLSLINPFPSNSLLDLIKPNSKVLVLEDNYCSFGFSSQVISIIAEQYTDVRCMRVSAKNTPIPASRLLEDYVLLNITDVVDAGIKLYSKEL